MAIIGSLLTTRQSLLSLLMGKKHFYLRTLKLCSGTRCGLQMRADLIPSPRSVTIVATRFGHRLVFSVVAGGRRTTIDQLIRLARKSKLVKVPVGVHSDLNVRSCSIEQCFHFLPFAGTVHGNTLKEQRVFLVGPPPSFPTRNRNRR